MTKEHAFSPEQIAAIKEIIEKETGIDFAQLLKAYKEDPSALEYRDGKELTEFDLLADILDDGKLQLGDEAGFSDIVITGALERAASLGLL